MSHDPIDLNPSTLVELRDGIDAIDDRIHDLLMKRAELVMRVGELKGKGPAGTPFYRPEREAQIHRRLEGRHGGPLPVEAVHRIFREIISASLNLEKQLSVAYLGPEATFTHEAALKQFGSAFTMFSTRTITEVFHEVEIGRANFGVVPVENSLEGVVIHTLDRFVRSPLNICGEVLMPVELNLLARGGVLGEVRVIYGHFSALDQCAQWLSHYLPQVKRVEVASTAEAAERARREEGAGAICGPFAANRYGLVVIAEHIEDQARLENRFLVVGRESPAPSGADKTSIMVSFLDDPGFLHRILGVFAERGINLSRIESRPTQERAWDYLFFIDMEGHRQDEGVSAALEALGALSGVSVKILGSYPQHAL
ncbi:chorismate mutase [Magnetococcus marinus MC-1]|uniref:Bifunctional chorismate mutase/prephenate dehydratase n=1 Tax=Magnetococcus marinus (strain ATCC BAA-1437 / JCM 17883 / MC-1) TaxID=156889 RepID=A0L410_MAGMM|nr:prephenate dehydratase [Magnetococcus marinus]ABK42703.1 chorismate mutase [Magnetococcus marinus MC-1]